MKNLFIPALLLCLSAAVFGQQKMYNADSLLKQYNQQHAKVTLAPITKFKPQQQPPVYAKADTARLSHMAASGYVYLLPQDKMPCLKPFDQTTAFNPIEDGIQVHVPGTGGIIYNMPNALAQQALVFESKPGL